MNSYQHTLASYPQNPFRDASGFDPAAVWSDEFLADVDDSIDFGDDADRSLVQALDDEPESNNHHIPPTQDKGYNHPHTTTSHLHRVA
ncbi:hypothetical protein GII36_02205 [Candidatus Mycosynbacter amalyticus]|uniref:Uncharacterized protein n=1 Tax=Candidatus Mycosynbacter amalyticus TaxID=2665156 RepID=A0A857MPR9_9BACT|nr:hypothetical protein [Candidatus Mycosynbacter amalyticus]QHN42660.1 hypothetical protein GII36_02205 [Candidatus Mycosynbacter amalyticus]